MVHGAYGTTIDFESIAEVFAQSADAYQAAKPFPHAVFDGLFDPELLRAVEAEFPPPDGMSQQFSTPLEVKSAEDKWASLGPSTRAFIADLNSGPFISALESLTGIDGLVTDCHLLGGGLHQIRPGGKLKVHADFNFHPQLRLERRLNVLVFLNDDWDEAWGGHLELWDLEMTHAVERVSPTMNRCVIFTTTSTSFHGHPEPLRCPPDRRRRSVALYYYSLPQGSNQAPQEHSTLFKSRPQSRRDLVDGYTARVTHFAQRAAKKVRGV